MRPRDIAFTTAALLLLAALGLAVWGGEAPPAAGPEARAPEPALAEPAEPATPIETAVAPGTTGAALRDPSVPAPAGRTIGAIRGHISLDARVVRELEFVHVRVREALNTSGAAVGDGPLPFVKTVKEEIAPRLGTPQFFYDGIPFSEYGYVVRVLAPGYNGSEQFVRLNEENPIADVTLSVTAGMPFTVILRDQLSAPSIGKTVFLVPIGEPAGRTVLRQDSDGFGVAVFESVLQGEYEVRVGSMNEPHNKPSRITVMGHAGSRSATIEVPLGYDLNILVQSVHGWGVEGAKLMLYATDTRRFRKYEGQTDYSGKFVFSHLPPGSYQLNVSSQGYEYWSRTIKVLEDEPPADIVVPLVPH